MVNAIDPCWGSLQRVRTLKVPLLTQLYKWILITEQGGEGFAEVTSIGELLIIFLTLVPTPLQGP